MGCRSILFAVLLATVLGCGKAPSTGDPPKGDAPKSDPDTAYVIKIREKQVGEKYEITRTQTRSMLEIQGNGKDKKPDAPTLNKVTTKAVYTEEVEAVDGSAVTKGKRKYTVAEGDVDGKTKSLSFVGKTVAFEAKGDRFIFKFEDGKEVPLGPESFALNDDSDRNRLKNLRALVPERAVKVGESWEVPADKLAAAFGPNTKGARLKISGKLDKAYTKDGKQFGVIVIKIESSPEGAGPGLTAELTYDGCIDGSVTESTRTSVETFKVPAAGPGKPEVPDIVNTSERTIKPAK